MKQQNLLKSNNALSLLQSSENMLLKKGRQDMMLFYIRIHTAKIQPKTSVKVDRKQEFKELLTLTDLPRLESFWRKYRLSESEEYQLISALLMDMDDEYVADEIIRMYFEDNGFHSEKVMELVRNAGISLLRHKHEGSKVYLGKYFWNDKKINLVINHNLMYIVCRGRYYPVPRYFYNSAECFTHEDLNIYESIKRIREGNIINRKQVQDLHYEAEHIIASHG